MKHILVPTDFSDDARNASHYAAHLAEKFKANLTLLHAYMLPTPVSEVPYVMINAEEMQRENEEIARVEAEKLGSAYNVKVNYVVRLGFPSDEIESVIEDMGADFVVMGMKGKGTLEKIVGSTTTSTLKKIHNPLLIVPEKKSTRLNSSHTIISYDWSSDVCSSDRKSTRLNSSHTIISYAVFCLQKNMTPEERADRGGAPADQHDRSREEPRP